MAVAQVCVVANQSRGEVAHCVRRAVVGGVVNDDCFEVQAITDGGGEEGLQAIHEVGANVPTNYDDTDIGATLRGGESCVVLNEVLPYVRLSHIHHLSTTLRMQSSGAVWRI